MHNENINSRVAKLRAYMQERGLSAFIIPTTDPHMSEYTPQHWQTRAWITGFDGSAGTAVVTLNKAALWTDSRYFIAAASALEGTPYELMKQGTDGTPGIGEWLAATLESGGTAGVDGTVVTQAFCDELAAVLMPKGITLDLTHDPFAEIYPDRPALPDNPVTVHPLEYAGETAASKIERILAEAAKKGCTSVFVSALDDIAWTLNLRGTDVHCNPVFVAYLLMEGDRTTLFVDQAKLSPEVSAYLASVGVGVAPYADVARALRAYGEYSLLMDPAATCHTLFNAVRGVEVVGLPSPVAAMKAVKTGAEIEGFRRAMLRDGVAMVRFLRWLRPAVEAGGQTEMSAAARLEALRAGQQLYRGPSFDTISAYADHGAIVHYEPTPATDAPLRPEGLLLVDSGAQYLDGTTDITRTIALGPLTEEQRRVYTLVLKAHIALERAVFPDGASGTQIDAIAREPLWREGLNYLHGTGHGVGSYLNVHEGPHQIRMEWKPAPLRAGMTVTDEPGIYLAGRFGVRTENTLLIVPHAETECGRFLAFEPLTLCPIDREPIVAEMLTAGEREWLDGYHATVYERLSPLLTADECSWLARACAPL